MPESVQIIIGILSVLIVYVLVMLGTGWWTKRICLTIIKELEERGALNASTAVALPYDKSINFKIGYRDYRPKALESLVLSEVVCKTFNGQYYLNKEKLAEINTQKTS
jgi:hypothetical protein